jgi:peptidoglycan/LPS O-acetylase OafA/YrhL
MPLKRKAAKFTLAGMLVMICCLAGLSFLHTDEFYGDHHPIGIVINNLLLPVAGIAVLFWGLLTEDNFITKMLASAPMVLFGKSSYIFYLVHLGLFATVFYNGITHNPLLLFIYLNIVSVLLYLGFEKPVNMFLRKKLLRPERIIVSKNER